MAIIPEPLFRKLREEEVIQAGMVEYLEVSFPRYESSLIWFHVPNQRMGKLARIICKYMGVLPGIPDLVFLAADDFRVFVGFVEVKTEKGRLSSNQRLFKLWAEKLGLDYVVCKSLEDLEKTLKQWDLHPKGSVL